ncbi:MAG: orotate phosphoribosyltransferase [Tissierellia bacterium]|nr:orotate phosphoribosyltransferase [Tissierellia bacterium]
MEKNFQRVTGSQIAQVLLDIEAVLLSPNKPFTWASGIKSPIYCDNRLILSHPRERTVVEEALAGAIQEHYPQAEAILGTATAGIPHASIVAHLLDLPGGFIRSKAKDHGTGKKVEGAFRPGQKVVVVEDLLSTGGSSIEAAQSARKEGLEVLGVAALFTYELKESREKFQEAKLDYHALATFTDLTQVALKRGLLDEKHLEALARWRENPRDEAWILE